MIEQLNTLICIFLQSQLHVIVQRQYVPSAERAIWMRSQTPNWSIVGSILAATHDTYVKSQSTLYRKSWGFSGYSGFLPQGMLTGWVGIRS
jgi:hypothetical protein